jgi:2-polyprenyl-3-methyl-5-hydroxy-6-metoxy-1,4-benzoquinol methylase
MPATIAQESVRYAAPREVVDPAECKFYHRMDVPGLGEVGDQWDLRDCVDEYLGNYNFAGQRVLDVGAASGFLSFEMEKRGADVVAFDMDGGHRWNIVPYYDVSPAEQEKIRQQVTRSNHRTINAFWYVHRALRSNVRAYYGDIYDIPEALGPFDVVYFGMILTHLRDPFQALYSAGRLATDAIIITNQVSEGVGPTAAFAPNIETRAERAWWLPTEACLERMLGVLGFKLESKVYSEPKLVTLRPGPKRCVSMVFRHV